MFGICGTPRALGILTILKDPIITIDINIVTISRTGVNIPNT
jgi:hypothetical protein